MHEVLQEYGDAVRWRGLFDMCIVNHPDLIRPVLTQDYRHFSKNTTHYRLLRQVLGNGLVTNDGPDWVRQRRLIQPAFASRRLARFDGAINALTSSLVTRWERQDPAEAVWIDREMSALTFDIVGETLFGRDIKEHAREMAEILEVVNLSSNDLRSFLTLYPWIPTAYNRKWKRAMKRLDGIVYGLMEGRGADGNGGGRPPGPALRGPRRRDRRGHARPADPDEVVTLILAGHETSAMALSWTLYLLATHPEIRGPPRGASRGQPARRAGGSEDLPRLTYLKQVVQEAMRIYPPVWGYVRRAEAETELGDYVLPARTWVGVVTWALHRRPDFWPDPERFDPDRFAPERAEERDFFAYLPFAADPAPVSGPDGDARDPVDPRPARAAVPDARRPGHPIETEAVVTLKPRHGIPVTLSRR